MPHWTCKGSEWHWCFFFPKFFTDCALFFLTTTKRPDISSTMKVENQTESPTQLSLPGVPVQRRRKPNVRRYSRIKHTKLRRNGKKRLTKAAIMQQKQRDLCVTIQDFPDVIKQRVACIVWWDKYSDTHVPTVPELKQLVRDQVSTYLFDEYAIAPWLCRVGYTMKDALRRLTPRKTYEQTPETEGMYGPARERRKQNRNDTGPEYRYSLIELG